MSKILLGRALYTYFSAKHGSGFKVSEIAQQVGVHSATLSRYLHGHTDMQASTVFTLLKLVGIDVQKQLRKKIDTLLNPGNEDQLDEDFAHHLQTVAERMAPISRNILVGRIVSHGSSILEKDVELVESLKYLKSYLENRPVSEGRGVG